MENALMSISEPLDFKPLGVHALVQPRLKSSYGPDMAYVAKSQFFYLFKKHFSNE